MNVQQMEDIARGAIERNADWSEDAASDDIYDAAYILALYALIDAGVDNATAVAVAQHMAMSYANP